ncbi:Pentatricopeptide repeat-containing protein [Glycine soja]|uniref:Protein-S-isoprenylcysteine O-methyltransferase n=1 Tax=Glycine soja TaxID=3848 RepID=A0A0B2SA91_GLYSO|nr:Pentatricopeptide repeat-containing protein [Glycine soja]
MTEILSYTASRQLSQMFLGIALFHGSEYFLAAVIHGRSNVTLKNTVISDLGLALVVIGEIIRKMGILTAGKAFTHLIKIYHEEQHQLITHGIYSYIRHPRYCGFLIWSVGTQIMLCNPISTIAFAAVVWCFFAKRLFNSMSEEHGFEPKREHYACMVTLLSRVGKLEEAYSIIKEMPFEPDACVWGALLSSCRVHNNLSLGEITAEKLFLLEPTNPGNYIILSNIYASKGLWDEENRIREVMKSKGLRKNPGYSWIEVGHKIHMLLAGDQSHPQMKDILEKLDKLNMEMKKSGYLPKSNFVWQDVEEHDKEQILCGHSEKLAVVLGLLNTSPGQPLQVIKNLRICDDCHAVIKVISRLEGREIYVRDTNRLHHFKDGVCSCGDFW